MPKKHGYSSTVEYRLWCEMKYRCQNANSPKFKHYGGRGIKVCQRWQDGFEYFLADVGLRPSPVHSLGRINNDGNYEPGNVEWQTETAQQRNRRSTRFFVHNGERKCTTEWAEIIGVSETTIRRRIGKGVPIDQYEAPTMRKAELRIAALESELEAWRTEASLCRDEYGGYESIAARVPLWRRAVDVMRRCEMSAPLQEEADDIVAKLAALEAQEPK